MANGELVWCEPRQRTFVAWQWLEWRTRCGLYSVLWVLRSDGVAVSTPRYLAMCRASNTAHWGLVHYQRFAYGSLLGAKQACQREADTRSRLK